jgi:uncharacterized protein
VPIEFDPTKNAANLAKHGVALTEGDGVLHDPLCRTREDEVVEGEQRWISVGTNLFGTLLVIVWTRRQGIERIISVRKPEPKERKDYEAKR